MNFLALVDGSGVYGSLLHYVLVIALVGSAIIIFIGLWWNGKLNMGEDPKYIMMKDEEASSLEEKNGK